MKTSATEVVRELGSLCLMGKVTAQLNNPEDAALYRCWLLLLFPERPKQTTGSSRVCLLQSSTPQGNVFQDDCATGFVDCSQTMIQNPDKTLSKKKNNILKLLIIQLYPLRSFWLSILLLKATAALIFSFSTSSKADDLSTKTPSPQMT